MEANPSWHCSSHGGTGNSAFGNPVFRTDQTFPERLKMNNRVTKSTLAQLKPGQTLRRVSAGRGVQANWYKNEILLIARGLGACQTSSAYQEVPEAVFGSNTHIWGEDVKEWCWFYCCLIKLS